MSACLSSPGIRSSASLATWRVQAEDCTITAEIMSINRGGALVNFEGLRGFLPGSHAPQGLTEDSVGKVLPLKFLEVDQAKNRLVVSNRRAMVEAKLTNLEPGQLVNGVVRSIKPYGAFVDIGGITGLLHISQISHDHITDVTKVLSEGQEISAMILTQVPYIYTHAHTPMILTQVPPPLPCPHPARLHAYPNWMKGCKAARFRYRHQTVHCSRPSPSFPPAPSPPTFPPPLPGARESAPDEK